MKMCQHSVGNELQNYQNKKKTKSKDLSIRIKNVYEKFESLIDK